VDEGKWEKEAKRKMKSFLLFFLAFIFVKEGGGLGLGLVSQVEP